MSETQEPVISVEINPTTGNILLRPKDMEMSVGMK